VHYYLYSCNVQEFVKGECPSWLGSSQVSLNNASSDVQEMLNILQQSSASSSAIFVSLLGWLNCLRVADKEFMAT